mgnify:FL=1
MFAGAGPRREARQSNASAGPSTSAHQPEVKRHQIRAGSFKHRLAMYETPPTEEITLEEFETWAIDRLRGPSRPCPDCVGA